MKHLTLHYDENGFDTGLLSFSKSRMLGQLKAKPSLVSILPAFAKDREEVERFIMGVYAKAYGARIQVRYPVKSRPAGHKDNSRD